jgi:hypothetical protein
MTELLAWIEKHPGTASWVQAIFSVVAIGVAIWVAWASEQRRVAAARADARRIVANALQLASDAHYALGDIDATRSAVGQSETSAQRYAQARRLQLLTQALGTIPLHELPSGEAVRRVMEVRSNLIKGNEMVLSNPAANPMICGEEYGRPWRPLVGSTREAVEILTDEVHRFT